MPPFKPRPFAQPPSDFAAPRPQDALRELTICAVASALTDPAERAAYLDSTCGEDAELRERTEQRIAERLEISRSDSASAAAPSLKLRAVPPAWKTAGESRASAAPKNESSGHTPEPDAPLFGVGEPRPAPPIPPPQFGVPGTQLVRIPETRPDASAAGQPSAVALVPMSAHQLATATGPFRSNTFPWITATVLAAVVGALAVFFFQEKDARQRAENVAEQARAASAAAELARAEIVARSEQTVAAQSQQIATTKTELDRVRADADSLRAESAQLRVQASAHSQQALTARAEADKLRAELEQQRAPVLTPPPATPAPAPPASANVGASPPNPASAADAAAALAELHLEKRRFSEAETAARNLLEILAGQGIEGWPTADAHSLLGAALFQKNKDADAAVEFNAAIQKIDALGVPATDADKVRLAAIGKRLVLFYTATGQRKTALDWKRKLEALRAR